MPLLEQPLTSLHAYLELRLWRTVTASSPQTLDTPFPVTLHLENGTD